MQKPNYAQYLRDFLIPITHNKPWRLLKCDEDDPNHAPGEPQADEAEEALDASRPDESTPATK